MDTQQKKDRLTGLLSIAADKTAPSHCLSPEELARLVDDLENDLNGRLYAHLSSCEKCYSQWLLLKKTDDKTSKKGGILRFPGRKTYKYIGSGLAVAATVALYLNIADFNNLAPQLEISVDKGAIETEADGLGVPVDKQEMDLAGDTKVQPASPSAEALQSRSRREAVPLKLRIQQLEKASQDTEITVGASVLDSPADKDTEEQVGEGAVAPLPVPPPHKTTVQQKKFESKVDSVSPSPQSVPLMKEKAGRSFSVMDNQKERYNGPEEEAISPYEFLGERIERGCRMKEYDPRFWQQLLGEAENVLELSVVGVKQEIVVELHALVVGMDEASFRSRCATMLQILAEEDKSR